MHEKCQQVFVFDALVLVKPVSLPALRIRLASCSPCEDIIRTCTVVFVTEDLCAERWNIWLFIRSAVTRLDVDSISVSLIIPIISKLPMSATSTLGSQSFSIPPAPWSLLTLSVVVLGVSGTPIDPSISLQFPPISVMLTHSPIIPCATTTTAYLLSSGKPQFWTSGMIIFAASR